MSLHHNEDCNLDARMEQIEQKIFSVDIVDIAIVAIGPTGWPGIHEFKGITAIVELWLPSNDHGFGVKGVAAPKASSELIVRNVTAFPGWMTLFWLFGVILLIRNCLILGPFLPRPLVLSWLLFLFIFCLLILV